MITVVPEGGLCNRLRVVASAALLARACGQRMQVRWYRTPDFNSRFDHLFSTHALPFEVSERTAMGRPAKLMLRLGERLAALGGAVRLGPRETDPRHFDFDAAVRRVGRRDAIVRSNSRLASAPGMFDLFVPVGDAALRFDALRARLARSVAVHVRRTDNTQAAAHSTLERFIALMQAELSVRDDTEFFVATDEPDVMRTLRESFGERVWEYPKRAYARDDPTALVDAVVDLYGLGHCRKLIGSYWSSFTDTAAALRGIECVIARHGATP